MNEVQLAANREAIAQYLAERKREYERGPVQITDTMCGYDEPWTGRCTNEKPCAQHGNKKCWKCGEPATYGCSMAWSFVCGNPCCPKHECSCWGSHEHRPFISSFIRGE